jgi:Xaa-Pro aminopeptidase
MFDPAVFAVRRDAYMQALGPKAVAVVRSLPERLRNGDAYHPFRQLSDLIYLTGFVEPETTLILRPGAETERVVMFV